MTIGTHRGDWLRRMRAEMHEAPQTPAPIIVRFAATDAPSSETRPLILASTEGLMPPAILMPVTPRSDLLVGRHYAH